MKPKSVHTLAHESAMRLYLEKGSAQYDYFCAGFCRGVRSAQNRVGWLVHKNRMVPAITGNTSGRTRKN